MQKIIDEFLNEMKLEGKAASTLETYNYRLQTFRKYFEEHNLNFERTKKADLFTFLEQKYSDCSQISTIRGLLATFHVINLWCVKKGYMDSEIISPKDYPKNTQKSRIKRLSDDEIKIFKSYIDELQPNARAAFYLMLGSGCRVGEAANLRPEDITLMGKKVYIDIHEAKWGSDRIIPIIDPTAAEIVWKYRADLEVDSMPLFRLSKRTLQSYATNFARKTGVAFRCHLLRHTFAALLTEQGVPLTTTQFLLGHKSLGMTAHYAQSALADVSSIDVTI